MGERNWITVATRSTQGDEIAYKSRWVEIAVYLRPESFIRRWQLVVKKKSDVQGESTITNKYPARHWWEMFDCVPMSTPMREVRNNVDRWARENGHG